MTKKILVPQARTSMNQFKKDVMNSQGYEAKTPGNVKYEVAEDLHIPLTHGDNGELTSKEAGKIGGKIGGSMVQEMIRMALNKDKT